VAGTGAQIIATVHELIILEVFDGVGKGTAVILKETMIQARKAYLSRILVDVEGTIGGTWA